MKLTAVLTAASIVVVSLPAHAQQRDEHPAHHPVTLAQAATLTEGEVRKVDKDAKKITIRHGPIVNLDMPAMTMVFQAKEPAMLDQVKAGDKIRFAAERTSGAYIVTRIEPAK